MGHLLFFISTGLFSYVFWLVQTNHNFILYLVGMIISITMYGASLLMKYMDEKFKIKHYQYWHAIGLQWFFGIWLLAQLVVSLE